MDPHITVLAPDTPLVPANEAIDLFCRLELPATPFSITAHTLTVFERRHSRTFVLAAEPKLKLQELFATITKQTSWQNTGQSRKYPYEPHVTLVNQVPADTWETIYRGLARAKPSLSFECRTICLYTKAARWPRWQLLASIDLAHR
jgi:2'-5' RNA ligase